MKKIVFLVVCFSTINCSTTTSTKSPEKRLIGAWLQDFSLSEEYILRHEYSSSYLSARKLLSQVIKAKVYEFKDDKTVIETIYSFTSKSVRSGTWEIDLGGILSMKRWNDWKVTTFLDGKKLNSQKTATDTIVKYLIIKNKDRLLQLKEIEGRTIHPIPNFYRKMD